MFINWTAKIKKKKMQITRLIFQKVNRNECCWLLIWPNRNDQSGGSQLGWANWEKQTLCRDKSNWKNVVDTGGYSSSIKHFATCFNENIFRQNLSFFFSSPLFNSLATVTIANLLCIQMSACNLIIFEE